eukprot:Phypoly_transcript_08650.p1 GENE.Phypoly_transcript_08650~~Phypoly_transcript_08650.p1  ORF type:complete len:366 (+),score=77.57 Phypoly_transcript_08650:374-1471(+)
MDAVNMMRALRWKPTLELNDDDTILIVEQNRDPEGLCVVTIDEFSQGATLRIVKYNVGAAEFTFKMSGSTYTQRAPHVEVSTARAVEELLEQYKLELVNKEKTQWQYHVAARNCETFVLYCKGVIRREDQYSDQVSAALVLFKSVGALTLNRGVTSTIGMIARLKTVSTQLYLFARSIATGTAMRDAAAVAAGVGNICTHLVMCGIGAGLQFTIEVSVNLVRWLLRIWNKNHWLAISTKTFFQEMLKSISRSVFSFAGSLLGMLAGAPGGPLAIVTAVLGSILASYMGHKFMTMFLTWREKQAQEEMLLLTENSEGVKEEDRRLLEVVEKKGEGEEDTQFLIRDLQEDETIVVEVDEDGEGWVLV